MYGKRIAVMTNYEKILKDMSIEYLATLLIETTMRDDGDYSYDGEDEYWVENYCEFFTTYANENLYSDYDEALEDTIEWLKKEYIQNGNDIQE